MCLDLTSGSLRREVPRSEVVSIHGVLFTLLSTYQIPLKDGLVSRTLEVQPAADQGEDEKRRGQ